MATTANIAAVQLANRASRNPPFVQLASSGSLRLLSWIRSGGATAEVFWEADFELFCLKVCLRSLGYAVFKRGDIRPETLSKFR